MQLQRERRDLQHPGLSSAKFYIVEEGKVHQHSQSSGCGTPMNMRGNQILMAAVYHARVKNNS